MNTGEHRDSAAAPLVADSAPSVHLAIQNGTQKGTRIRCRHVVTLVGSRDHCKIRLPHDRVAPVHLAIINDGKQVTVIDLLSEWGTRLNDLKLEQEKLSDGDRLEVGPWDFLVQIAASPRNGKAEVINLEPTPQCVALEHVESGRVLQPNRNACLIGRRNGCDIVLSDPDVSRAHALLINYHDYPAIVDLASKVGTKVNGEPVTFRVLQDEDLIAIGHSEFRVRIVGTAVVEKASKAGKSGAGTKAAANGKAANGSVLASPLAKRGRGGAENAELITNEVAGNGSLSEDAPLSDSSAALALLTGDAATSAEDLAASIDLLDSSSSSPSANGRLLANGVSTPSPLANAVSRPSPAGKEGQKGVNGTEEANVAEEHEPDLISIEAVDKAQRWRIADDAEKVSRLEKAGGRR